MTQKIEARDEDGSYVEAELVDETSEVDTVTGEIIDAELVGEALSIPTVLPTDDLIRAALAYAQVGWYVLPIRRSSKHPGSVVGKAWQSKSSKDPEQIVAWFAGTDHCLALHVGRSGAVAFDVDRPDNLPDTMAQAFARRDVPFQSTRHGVDERARGHYLFTVPAGRELGNSAGKLGKAWGEVRGRNGIVVVVPSTHEKAHEGGRYVWERTGPLPVLPAALAEAMPDALSADDAATDAEVRTFLAKHVDSTRPDLLGAPIKSFRDITAAGGGRHDTMCGRLVWAFKEARAGYYPAADAETKLRKYFLASLTIGNARRAVGGEWEGLLSWAVAQARAADLDEVRRIAASQPDLLAGDPAPASPASPQPDRASEPGPSPVALLVRGWHDDGNALRLVDEYHDTIRRVSDMRGWLWWDAERWAADHEDRHVREDARHLARELPDHDAAAKSFKRNSLSSAGLSAAVRIAETDPRVAIRAMSLDAHPHLLNTRSGVVDLRTGEVGYPDPGHLMTRITPGRVDPDGPHPRWNAFLAETFDGDPSLIDYVQQLCGLALTGEVREHILPFFYGTGANGKGALVLVLQGLLGGAETAGYAVSAPDGFLMANREGVHPTEIARLRGARLVICSEQTSGRRFDEAKVKRLTGGDILTGRFMRADFFDFVPSHLMLVMSNHLPQVKEGGPSFWRRVRLVPFDHIVPEDRRNPDLHNELVEKEGPAILGWMVRGAMTVYARGLVEPKKVISATEEYRISEDSLASFVRDECFTGPHQHCPVADFTARYQSHCSELDVEPLSQRAVTMRLTREYAVEQGRLSRPSRRIYRRIGLQDHDDG